MVKVIMPKNTKNKVVNYKTKKITFPKNTKNIIFDKDYVEDYTFIQLIPKFEKVKSYYKKAMVKKEGNKIILLSYNIKVAYIQNNKAYILGKKFGFVTKISKRMPKTMKTGKNVKNRMRIIKETEFGSVKNWSNTTYRHIIEFFKQNGFIARSWRQMVKDYGIEDLEPKADKDDCGVEGFVNVKANIFSDVIKGGEK